MLRSVAPAASTAAGSSAHSRETATRSVDEAVSVSVVGERHAGALCSPTLTCAATTLVLCCAPGLQVPQLRGVCCLLLERQADEGCVRACKTHALHRACTRCERWLLRVLRCAAVAAARVGWWLR